MNQLINKKTVTSFLVCILVILVFFSKTIYAHGLPTVNGGLPKSGRLVKETTTSGVADWKNTEKIYAPVGGKITQIHAAVGDSVEEGAPLFDVEFDHGEMKDKLAGIGIDINQTNLEVANLELQLEELERNIKHLNGEDYNDNLDSEYEQRQLALEIRNAQDKLKDVKERHDNGEATDQEIDDAKHSLRALYLKEEYLEDSAKEKTEDSELTREQKLEKYEDEKATLKNSLKSKELNISNFSLQAKPYRQALEDFETYATITAPAAGVLTSMPVSKGETVSENQLLVEIGIKGSLKVQGSLPLDNDFVTVGSKVALSNAKHTLEGKVVSMTANETGKTVQVEATSDKVFSGESFTIDFYYETETKYTLVPNEALNQDKDGYFINQIKRRDGIMGEEYHLEKLPVFVGSSDGKNTVITGGITFFEPMAISSDKATKAGDVIKLENEDDFFEK